MAKLGDYISIKHGYAFKGDGITTEDNGVVLVTPGNFATGGGFKEEKCKFFSDQYSSDFVLSPGDLIVTMTDLSKEMDTLGYSALVPKSNRVYLHNQRIGLISINREGLDKHYLYWFMRSRDYQRTIAGGASGTTVHHTSPSRICEVQINFPDLLTQKKIARLLDSLEDKIQNNNKINNNLAEQANALYQSFFSPKSDTQGKVVTLDEYCSIFTGKKNANASVEGGKYKFFTCAPDALQIDSYIYDGNVIIVSGNGAYTGRTRFYSGRFDLYQRTYACTLLDHVNPDYIFPLYWFVKLELSKKIMGGTRGSAIPYIVMNDLAKFEFVYDEKTFATYMPVFKSLTESIQVNEFENERLAEMRDALLPQLLSWQLDVSNIDD